MLKLKNLSTHSHSRSQGTKYAVLPPDPLNWLLLRHITYIKSTEFQQSMYSFITVASEEMHDQITIALCRCKGSE